MWVQISLYKLVLWDLKFTPYHYDK